MCFLHFISFGPELPRRPLKTTDAHGAVSFLNGHLSKDDGNHGLVCLAETNNPVLPAVVSTTDSDFHVATAVVDFKGNAQCHRNPRMWMFNPQMKR